jgi:hypothetical protein
MTAAFLFALGSAARAQTVPRPGASPDPTTTKSKDESDTRFGTPENEMRSKAALKEEKKRYDENLARAREVSELATQLCKTYELKKSFTADDGKRLERLEKLTKRIRNEAGGSDSQSDAHMKDIGATKQETLKNLADIAEELQKMVEKTPRNVISTAVIDQANRLIGVTQHLRASR